MRLGIAAVGQGGGRSRCLCLIVCLEVLLQAAFVNGSRPRPNILKRRNPTYSALSQDSLQSLSELTDMDAILDFNHPESALSKILIPRVAGTKNLTRVQDLLVSHFTKLKWHVEKDRFTSDTPYGMKVFTNLIFTHDPSAARRLVLSAHIDSKYFPTHPDDQFVGATDSAAPCAMLLDVAQALTPWMDKRKERVVVLEGGEEGRPIQGETLQIVFFDGEEAFKDWTHTDSIYGARHLADLWSKPDSTPSPTKSIASTPLSRVSHLVLLDLLGSVNPVVRSFYTSTGWFFDEFAHAEERLGSEGLLWDGYKGESYESVKFKLNVRERTFFVPRKSGPSSYAGWIEDDHVPFVEKGVPVVHLISVPFPKVWHTIADDATALDLPTIKAWSLIIRLTVTEYLGLDPTITVQKDWASRQQEQMKTEL